MATQRFVRPVLIVVGASIVIGAGALLGSRLVTPGLAQRIAGASDLFEIHTATGSFIVGSYRGEDDEFIRIALPASVAPDPDNDEQYTVTLLAENPFDLAGEIVVAKEQLVLAGPVAAGSALETGYWDAISGAAATSPGPTDAP